MSHTITDLKEVFGRENRRRAIRDAVLISQDDNYHESTRALFAQQAQELLAQLSTEALRTWINECEDTELEAISRGDAGCDAEPGFTAKCVENATIGRALLTERLRRDLDDPEQHILRSWLPPASMCREAE